MNPIFVIILSQALFTAGDVIARTNLRVTGFEMRAFLSWWFAAYCVLRTFATFAQLYVLATVQFGRSMALFGAMSIVVSNVLAVLLLREQLSLLEYGGVMLAITAFLVLAIGR